MAKKQKDEVKENTGKGKSKFIIFAIIALLVMGAGTFGGVYFYMQSKDPALAKIEPADYDLLKSTTVNLSDESGRAYLKTSLTLSYDSKNADLLAELDKKKVSIQDASIWYLKSKVSTDFSSENEKQLKQGLIDTINGILEEGTILDVYLVGSDGTNFVVQKV